MFLTVILAVIVLYLLHKLVTRGTYRGPPGPLGLPIVGYLPFLGNDPSKDYERLHRKYGTIFSLKLGSANAVVLGDFASCKEAMNHPALLSRPPNGIFPILHENFRYELADVSGTPWQMHRRFVLQSFRDLGFGKHSMEERIQEEVDTFAKYLQSKSGQPILMDEEMHCSITNNILLTLIGRSLPYDDPEHIFIDDTVKQMERFLGQGGVCIFFPWLIPVFKMLDIGGYKDCSANLKKLRDFFWREYQEHKRTLDRNYLRDYIDHYIVHMQDEKADPNIFNEEYLLGNSFVFFAAGTNTILQSTSWFTMMMCSRPELMRKVQAEIDHVIGRERWPTMADAQNMPFTKAVIKEVMRWPPIVPLNLIRYASEDVKIQGVLIPKDSYVIANFVRAHHDPKCWTKPEEFMPERFLDSDGKFAKSPDGYMPFSLGKRSCPGETMANIEVFLYCTFILQRFDILPEKTPVDLTPDRTGVLAVPKNQKIRFIERK